jgi:hypothetical protein
MAKTVQRKAPPARKAARTAPPKAGKANARAKANQPAKASRPSKADKPRRQSPSAAPAAAARQGAGPDVAAKVAGNLHFADKLLRDVAKGWPADQAAWQATPHDNHLLWTFGHLASANNWFASMIDGQPVGGRKDWEQHFTFQSKPVNDASKYPALHDVQAEYDRSLQRLSRAISSLNPAELANPPASDAMGMGQDKADIAMRAAWHIGWHTGQLSTVRRAMGLPSLF